MGMELDGSNQYVVLDDYFNLNIATFTIWLKANNWSNTNIVIGKNTYSNGYIQYSALSKLCYYAPGNTLTVNWGDVPTGSWYYVVLTVDGSYHRAYLDGVLVDSPVSSSLDLFTGSEDVWLGNMAAYGFYFDGILDDVRIYNRALSLPEIQSIYHSRGADNIVNGLKGRWLMNEKPDGTVASGANSCIDISGNNNHGTPQNSPIYKAAPVKLIKPRMIV